MPLDFSATSRPAEDALDFSASSRPAEAPLDFSAYSKPVDAAESLKEDSFSDIAAGLGRSLQRGIVSATAIPDQLALAESAGANRPTMRQERAAFVRAMTHPRYDETTDDLLGPKAQLERIMLPQVESQKATAQDVADLQKRVLDIPQTKAQRALVSAPDTSAKWAAWLKNPVELTASIALESLPASLVGATAGSVALGPGLGTAVGAGASSGIITFSSELLGDAQRQGVDLQDPEQTIAWINDAKRFRKSFNTAAIKAGIVGAVDAATAGTAGHFIEPAIKQGLRRVISASAKELGLQAAGGAGGEAIGQLASGQPIDTFDIAMEAAAEMVSSPGEIYGNLRQATGRAGGTPRAGIDVDFATWLKNNPPQTTTPDATPPLPQQESVLSERPGTLSRQPEQAPVQAPQPSADIGDSLQRATLSQAKPGPDTRAVRPWGDYLEERGSVEGPGPLPLGTLEAELGAALNVGRNLGIQSPESRQMASRYLSGNAPVPGKRMTPVARNRTMDNIGYESAVDAAPVVRKLQSIPTVRDGYDAAGIPIRGQNRYAEALYGFTTDQLLAARSYLKNNGGNAKALKAIDLAIESAVAPASAEAPAVPSRTPTTTAEPRIAVGEPGPLKETAPLSVDPNEMVPALRRSDGAIIPGKAGQIHQDIYSAQGKMDGNLLRVEQPEHGFLYQGQFLNRDDAGKLLNESGPVDAQRLIELQKTATREEVIPNAEEEKKLQEVAPTGEAPPVARAGPESGTLPGTGAVTAAPVAAASAESSKPETEIKQAQSKVTPLLGLVDFDNGGSLKQPVFWRTPATAEPSALTDDADYVQGVGTKRVTLLRAQDGSYHLTATWRDNKRVDRAYDPFAKPTRRGGERLRGGVTLTGEKGLLTRANNALAPEVSILLKTPVPTNWHVKLTRMEAAALAEFGMEEAKSRVGIEEPVNLSEAIAAKANVVGERSDEVESEETGTAAVKRLAKGTPEQVAQARAVEAAAARKMRTLNAEQLHEELGLRTGDTTEDIRSGLDDLEDSTVARPMLIRLLADIEFRYFNNELKALAQSPAEQRADLAHELHLRTKQRAVELLQGALGKSPERSGFAESLAQSTEPVQAPPETAVEVAAAGADTRAVEEAKATLPKPFADLPVRITDETNLTNDLHQGALASVDDTGNVVFNRASLANELARHETPEAAQRALRAVLTEEGIHRVALGVISDAEAAKAWNALNPISRAALREAYGPGNWSDSQLGHEYLRREIQRALGLELTERARAVTVVEKINQFALDLVERAISALRRVFGVKTNQELVDRIRAGIEGTVAVNVPETGGVRPAAPALDTDKVLAEAEAAAKELGGMAQVKTPLKATLFNAAQVLRQAAQPILTLAKQAAAKLDTNRYQNRQYLTAKKTLEGLRTFLEVEYAKRSSREIALMELGEGVPGILDPDFIGVMEALGVGTRTPLPPDFQSLNAANVRAMQEEVATEQAARAYYRLMVEKAQIIQTLREADKFGFDDDYKATFRADLERVQLQLDNRMQANPEAGTRGQSMFRERATLGEFGLPGEADTDKAWISVRGEDQALAKVKDFHQVKEAFGEPLDAAENLAAGLQRRLATFEEALNDPEISDEMQRKLAGDVLESLRDIRFYRENFETEKLPRRAELIEAMRAMEEQRAQGKIDEGTAAAYLKRIIEAMGSEAQREQAGVASAEENWMIAHASEIAIGAMRLARLPAWQTVRNGQAMLDLLTEPVDRHYRADDLGISNEAYDAMVQALQKSDMFRDGIATLAELGDRKLAEIPVVAARKISDLIESGDEAKAQAAFDHLSEKLGNRMSAAQRMTEAATRQLWKMAVEVRAIDLGKKLFDDVLGPRGEPKREVSEIERKVVEMTLQHPPMIVRDSGGSEYRAFEAKGIKQAEVKIDALKYQNPREAARLMADWYRSAATYTRSYFEALARSLSDPKAPTPEQLGFEPETVQGLMEALDSQDTDVAASNLNDEDRLRPSLWLAKMQNTVFWQEITKTIGLVQGLVRAPLHRDAQRWDEGISTAGRILKRDYQDMSAVRSAGLRSHPELNNNLERYHLLVVNGAAHFGRQTDSPLRAGFPLDNGIVVTSEDMAFLRKVEKFNQALRREITEPVKQDAAGRKYLRGGVVSQHRGTPNERRLTEGVGDLVLPRFLNTSRWGHAIARLTQAYQGTEGKQATVGADVDLSLTAVPAEGAPSQGWQIVAFWNEQVPDLVRHLYDAARTDSPLRRERPMILAALEVRRQLAVGERPAITDLQDLAQALAAALPDDFQPAQPRAAYAREELLKELAQYGRAAAQVKLTLTSQKVQEPGAGVELAPGPMFSSEFTQEAGQLALPSRWYDYGAVTDYGLNQMATRALNERALAFRDSLDRAIASMRAIRANATDPDKPVKFESAQYPDLHTFSQVLFDLEKLRKQLDNAESRELSGRGLVGEAFGLGTASLIAGPNVGITQVTLGGFFAVAMQHQLPGISRATITWKALSGQAKMVATMIANGLRHTRWGREMQAHFPGLVRNFLNEQADLVGEAQQMGFSHREPYRQEARRIWDSTQQFSSLEQEMEDTGARRFERKVRGRVRQASAGVKKIGAVSIGDFALNAWIIGEAGLVTESVRRVAARWALARDLSRPFDASDLFWQPTANDVPKAGFTPEKWLAGRSQRLGYLRQMFDRSDVSLERVLHRYSTAAAEAQRTGGEAPPVFTPEEFQRIKRTLVTEHNQPTMFTRPLASSYDKTFQFITTFLGYPTHASSMYAEAFSTTGRVQGLPARERLLGQMVPMLATLGGLALLGGALNLMLRRKENQLVGIEQAIPSILERDAYASPGAWFKGAAVGAAAAVPLAGDLALNILNVTVGSRGFDPASRVVGLNMLSSLLNAGRAALTQPVRDWPMVLTDFVVRPMFPYGKEILYPLNPRYRGERTYYNVKASVAINAENEIGIVRRTMTGRAGSDLSPTWGMRMKMASAALRQDWGEFQEQGQRLAEWHQERGHAEPQKAALRDFQAMHPVAKGAGRKLTEDEFARVQAGMTERQRAGVQEAIQVWAHGETLLGAAEPRSPVKESKTERVAVTGGSGGGGGRSAGGIGLRGLAPLGGLRGALVRAGGRASAGGGISVGGTGGGSTRIPAVRISTGGSRLRGMLTASAARPARMPSLRRGTVPKSKALRIPKARRGRIPRARRTRIPKASGGRRIRVVTA